MSKSKKARQITLPAEEQPVADGAVIEPAGEDVVIAEEPVMEQTVEEVVEVAEEQPVEVVEEQPVEQPAKVKPKDAAPAIKLEKGAKKSAVICFDGGKAMIIVDATPESVRAAWEKAKPEMGAGKFFKMLQTEFKVQPATMYNGVSLTLPLMVGTRPNLGDADYVELR